MPSSPAGSSRVLLSGKALGASAMISVGATRPCPYRGRGLLVTAPRHGWGRRGVGIIWGQARPVWSSPHRRGLSPHVLGGSGGGGGGLPPLAEASPRVPLGSGVGAGNGVEGSASLLPVEGGKIVDPAAQRVAYTGEVVGPSPPHQDAVKLGHAEAATRDSGRYATLAVLANLGHMAAGGVGFFRAHGADADNQAPALGALP